VDTGPRRRDLIVGPLTVDGGTVSRPSQSPHVLPHAGTQRTRPLSPGTRAELAPSAMARSRCRPKRSMLVACLLTALELLTDMRITAHRVTVLLSICLACGGRLVSSTTGDAASRAGDSAPGQNDNSVSTLASWPGELCIPFELAVQPYRIYWSLNCRSGHYIYTADARGAHVATLATPTANGPLVADAHGAYWADANGLFSADGLAATTTEVARLPSEVEGLAVDETTLFVSIEGSLLAIDKASSHGQRLVARSNELNGVVGLAVTSADIYWMTTTESVYSVPKLGGPIRLVAKGPRSPSPLGAITADGDTVFWTSPSLGSASKAVGAETSTVALGLVAPTTIAASGGRAFVATTVGQPAGELVILEIGPTGTAPVANVGRYGAVSVGRLAASANSLYWSASYSSSAYSFTSTLERLPLLLK
jgi:hypothetical protein